MDSTRPLAGPTLAFYTGSESVMSRGGVPQARSHDAESVNWHLHEMSISKELPTALLIERDGTRWKPS